jgi:GNAT superfamily N-acetyltransferase
MYIRTAKAEDIDAILSLLQQLWPGRELNQGNLQDIFYRGIENDDAMYLCAETDGNVIGFCAMAIRDSFWQAGPLAYIEIVIVDSNIRGQGIGTRLMEEAIDIARDRGCKKLELDSAFHREKAHGFYERNGLIKRGYIFSRDL